MKVLGAIIRQFGYEPVFLRDLDALEQSAVKANYQLLLVNIEYDRALLKGLINKSVLNSDIKNIPAISYKDMANGLFVHEIVTGLNRITRVILSLDELYSCLTDMLFRKCIIPIVDGINRGSGYGVLSHYARMTLGQVYIAEEKDILTGMKSLAEERMQELFQAQEDLRRSLLLAAAFTWLGIENRGESISTFGLNDRT